MEKKVMNTKIIIRFPLRFLLIDFDCQQNLATPSNEDPNKQRSWYHCICLFYYPNNVPPLSWGYTMQVASSLKLLIIYFWLFLPSPIIWNVCTTVIYRTILAALHFNWNLNRESLQDGQSNAKLHVTYPKFKEGEGTVREARVKENYGDSFSLHLSIVSLNMK